MEAKISLSHERDCHVVTNCNGRELGFYYPEAFAQQVANRVNLKAAAVLAVTAGEREIADKILDVIQDKFDESGDYLVVRVNYTTGRVSVNVSGHSPKQDFSDPRDARIFALGSGCKSVWFDHSVPFEFRRQIILGVEGFEPCVLPTA
jgi:hypothetical protein